MSMPLGRLGAAAIRTSFRSTSRRVHNPRLYQRRRQLHYTPIYRADADDRPDKGPAAAAKGASEDTSAQASSSSADDDVAELLPEGALKGQLSYSDNADQQPFKPREDIFSFNLTPEQEREAAEFFENPPDDLKEMIETMKRQMDSVGEPIVREVENAIRQDVDDYERPAKAGLMSMGDEEHEEPFEDEPYEGNDITSLGHGELEAHREIREYSRLAAWELPLLGKFSKPFELPGKDRPLRFRYTSYMGEEHPAENKVVLEFCTADLPLKPAERLKLVKLVGARYDPQTDMVKMSCESQESQAQNKRYLGDLLQTLMATARGKGSDAAAKDSFEDVPVDFRHVKWNQRPQFPEEWKMTPQREKLLQESRLAIAAGEEKRIEEGSLVDGREVIMESYKVSPTMRLLSNAQSARNANASKANRRPELRMR